MPAFVGRTRELEALRHALAAARAGHGATVLVTGEAGIGKTRLVSEVANDARAAGVEVLLGRSIDLVGTALPYQPFLEALRPLPEPRRFEQGAEGSQLQAFAEVLAQLGERASVTPVLLVLEDLHWADASSLDLVVFLAHNLRDHPLLLLGTCRADELSSRGRMRRLADGVRRSGSALVLELGPLAREELTDLLAADASAPPQPLCEAIATRAEGNPFFAEELLAAGGRQLPHRLRDLLLGRMTRLDRPTQTVLRLAAAAGREVGYPLLQATAALPEHELRESLRQAHEHGVLVAEQVTGSFRFRHALLAEAIYATILPGEREAIHARLAEELARLGAEAAELAPHWAAAGRSAEALAASIAAAREAGAVFGLAEALGHSERALALWDAVPDAPALAGCDLAELCARTADLANNVGAAPRAVELARRAIAVVSDPRRAARLHVDLGEYLYATGEDEPALAALQRAVELVPAEPPSAERAYALGSLAGGLMVSWRHADSLALAEQALALARELGAGEAEVRALTVIGVDVIRLGRAREGVEQLRAALRLAEAIGDSIGLDRAYVNLTDALTMLGRSVEAAQLGLAGLEAMRRHGVHSSLIAANRIEALLQIGDWDEADALSAAALRDTTSSFRSWLLILRAGVETGRGQLEAARGRLATVSVDGHQELAPYHAYVAELAWWERRWADAGRAVADGLAPASPRHAAPIRVQLCALGLRVQAELAALARARRDAGARRDRLERAGELLATARLAAADAASITPTAGAWLALSEAEHARAQDDAQPQRWSEAVAAWERLERAPLAAYCRWRQSEALVAAGAPRAEATTALRNAHAIATRLRARPLLDEIQRLAARARLDPTSPPPLSVPDAEPDRLGLTPRESEVLALVARGLTNREIADELVISVKTASVHVSHILHKLDASNRREAAAVAHRLAPHLG